MMLLPMLFTIVVYWLVGFNNSGPEHFLIFYLTYVSRQAHPDCPRN